MITPQEVSELGLPCYDNAQRLVKLETQLANIDKKLDTLISDPCVRCKNNDRVTTLRTEMKIVKWAGAVLGGTFLVTLVERFVK